MERKSVNALCRGGDSQFGRSGAEDPSRPSLPQLLSGQSATRPAPCPERSRPSVGKYVNEKHHSLEGFCVIDQTVALALSGGPSPVFLQAVEQVASFKKAFRRQGIGFADVVNTARFFLSRLESLFVSQKAFQIFRGRAELVRFASQRRDCVIYSVPLPLLSINPTDSPRHASRVQVSSC